MLLVLSASLLSGLSAAAEIAPVVNVEEDVYSFTSPNNGSGPLWSYGCTSILRLGDDLVVSQMETGADVPPLANTRWRVLRRTPEGWKLLAEAEGYRQREPCSLATVSRDAFYLNVNDSQAEAGVKYGPCKPYLIRFPLADASSRQIVSPVWTDAPNFTDHSYRGYAADRARGELLMLNIDAKTSVQNWCYLTASGEAVGHGQVTFPIRACYPQVALKNGGAYVLAVGDIVEPVQEWRAYKKEQTKQDWDYVFRILYFTWTPDLRARGFEAPIEIANVDATGGHIGNQDLWIAPDGSALILYTEREVQSALLRDKFLPDRSIVSSLHLATVKDGKITARRTIHEGAPGDEIGHARFQETPDGTLYALVYFGGNNAHGGGFLPSSHRRNALIQIYPEPAAPAFIPVPLKTPFTSYCLATVRAGNEPSNTIDLLGNAASGTVLSYAQIALKP